MVKHYRPEGPIRARTVKEALKIARKQFRGTRFTVAKVKFNRVWGGSRYYDPYLLLRKAKKRR